MVLERWHSKHVHAMNRFDVERFGLVVIFWAVLSSFSLYFESLGILVLNRSMTMNDTIGSWRGSASISDVYIDWLDKDWRGVEATLRL